jgi:hypothetical protein
MTDADYYKHLRFINKNPAARNGSFTSLGFNSTYRFNQKGHIVIAIRNNFAHLLAAAAVSISLMTSSSSPVFAAPAAPNEVKQDWAKQRQEWLKNRIDRLADRLEIKASQQGAWQAYVKTLEAVTEPPAKRPETKSDAASIARLHADLAAGRAQKLAQIADATAKLQEVLTPDQRKTLDQVVVRAGHRWQHFHGADRGEHAEHGGAHHWDHRE